MDYVKPADVLSSMLEAGQKKLGLAPRDLMIRGLLSGGLLGIATTLAFTAAVQTGQAWIGGLVFPVGFVIIVLLGLELVTGSFGLLPLAWIEGTASPLAILRNWGWVYLANLLGSLAFCALIAIELTNAGLTEPSGIASRIVAIAESKTIAYAALGPAGLLVAFIKAMLCNWMVCLGMILAMTTTSTIGKIATASIPIFIFFAQGFEHVVVNMFVIPAGMLMGAKISLADWWIWNMIPVTLGNIVGGFVLGPLALYLTYSPRIAGVSKAASLEAPVAE